MTFTSSFESQLPISSPLPARMTIARSGLLASFSAELNPAAIDNKPISTATTPAIPITITDDAPRRALMLRRFIQVISTICRSMFSAPSKRRRS